MEYFIQLLFVFLFKLFQEDPNSYISVVSDFGDMMLV